MANKYFKMMQDFRKAVKNLPKNAADAFYVEEYRYENVRFAAPILHEKNSKRTEYKVQLTPINTSEVEELFDTYWATLTDEEYEQLRAHTDKEVSADIVVHKVTLCEELQTIGRILEQTFEERRVMFVNGCINDIPVQSLAPIEADEYKRKLGKDLELMKAQYKKI